MYDLFFLNWGEIFWFERIPHVFLFLLSKYLNFCEFFLIPESDTPNVLIECTECQFLAAKAGSLIQHEKMKHRGIKFPCVLCDFAGETFDGLYEHIESVHF